MLGFMFFVTGAPDGVTISSNLDECVPITEMNGVPASGASRMILPVGVPASSISRCAPSPGLISPASAVISSGVSELEDGASGAVGAVAVGLVSVTLVLLVLP